MKNKIIIFTGPSGVGKATIEKRLFKDEDLKLHLVVSATTRKPRPNEVDGTHYWFLTKEEFDQKIFKDSFVEYSTHFSNKYGTLKSELARILEVGHNPLVEIETNGAKTFIDKFDPDTYVSIFIAPPSKNDLIKRIRERGYETEEQIQERVSRMEEELSYQDIFDYKVVNDDLDRVVLEIRNILKRELS